jgi:hypothetical protein
MTGTKPRAAKPAARKRKTRRTRATPTVPDLAAHPEVRELLGGSFMDTFNSTMQTIEWGEEEIAAAMREEPDHADRIWHSFKLLKPTHKLLFTDFIYRSHARELLTRVVARRDTRFATTAECCVACAEMSEITPLNATAAGLYSRVWRLAGFPEIDTRGEHHEALRGREIDDLEAALRTRLKDDARKLPRRIEHCRGCPEWREPHEQLTLTQSPNRELEGGPLCA